MQVPHAAVVLVADGGCWRLLRNAGTAVKIRLETVAEDRLDNPASHETQRDAPGRSFESASSARHAYAGADDHQQREDAFGRAAFDRLVAAAGPSTPAIIVAAPRMLGVLRAARSRHPRIEVLAEIDKDLTGHDLRDIAASLAAA
jgi:protein required for attachment to host cells